MLSEACLITSFHYKQAYKIVQTHDKQNSLRLCTLCHCTYRIWVNVRIGIDVRKGIKAASPIHPWATRKFLTDTPACTRYTERMRIALGSALIVLAGVGFWRALPWWLSLLNLLLGSLFLLLRWVSRQQHTTTTQDTATQDIANPPNTDTNL